jgi:hypothetical protein
MDGNRMKWIATFGVYTAEYATISYALQELTGWYGTVGTRKLLSLGIPKSA